MPKPHQKERLQELLHQEINRLFLKEAEFPLGAMVTLMRMELSADNTVATAWVSIFPKQYVDSVMQQLYRSSKFFLHQLIRRLNRAEVPQIVFKQDPGNEQIEEVERLLKERRIT